MHLVKRIYFPDNNKFIWPYLTCSEKLAYYQFQNDFDDISIIFCDSTNITLQEFSSNVLVDRASFNLKANFYYPESFHHVQNYNDFICNHIDHGKIIGVNTEFTLLPNFKWYQDQSHINSPHYSMIVGYDNSTYYLTDAPNLLSNKYIVKNNLSPIPKHIFYKVLSQKSNFIVVHKKDIDQLYLNIPALLVKIFDEYNYEMPQYENNRTVWYGKSALVRLYQLLDTEKILSTNLFEGAFIASTINGRRIFLLNALKKFSKKSSYYMLETILKESSNLWNILGNTILKSIIKKGYYIPDKEFFHKILITEDLLIKSYSNFLGAQ